jgi:UDP-N-acetyl-D-mannosaminuronic acid dehydrogenase
MGIGYVGLPLAIMLARKGYTVVGVDTNKEIVNSLNAGKPTSLSINEPKLQEILHDKKVRENLTASEKVCDADIYIVSVPTPLHKRKKEADLSYMVSAVKSILPYLKKGNLIIIESTIPPLTSREIIKPLIENATNLIVGKDVFLAHCPERILPGDVFYEIVHNDRVIGGIDERSSLMAKDVYVSFVEGEICITDDVTAELVKLMENTYRDVDIALANEFSLIAETLGVDINKAIEVANKHPRVNILSPGIGVGGHCLPVDPWFITEVDPKNSVIIQTARRINDEMPYKTATKIRKAVAKISSPKIIALGVTYKPNVHDLRESPALKVIDLLREEGYDVRAYDPLAEGYSFGSIKELAKDADCLVVLVEHKIIKDELDREEEKIKQAMRHPIIVRF